MYEQRDRGGRDGRIRRNRVGVGLLGAVGLALLVSPTTTSCSSFVDAPTRDDESVGTVRQFASAPVTVSFQNGVSPTTTYGGSTDTTIRQASPTTNYANATLLYADGDDGNGVDLSALIHWSIPGIPPGSVVQSASITLRVTNATANTYSLHGVLKPWLESQATWNRATTSANWSKAGALAAGDRGAAIGTITGATGSRTVPLNAEGVALVQSWINGGINAGVMIASASNTDGIDVTSTEGSTTSYRPKLTITYVPPDTSSGSGGSGGAGGSGGTGGATSGGATSGGESSGGATSGGESSGGATSGGTTSGGESSGGATSGGATSGGESSGGATSGGETGSGGVSGVTPIPTDPDLKIAFLGDTDHGSAFTRVLNLIKNEGAAAMVVGGDLSYSNNPTAWWNAVEAVLGTSFPVFLARGNHDDSVWTRYLPKAANHLGGATRVDGAHDSNYKITFRGIAMATIRKGDSGANIRPFLEDDPHLWKICNWHQNQAAMQVGEKGDEMGWDVYETCRDLGAIITTGHEHSYERTKTLANFSTQLVDPSCSGRNTLCVGPGRTFVSVNGLGGHGPRPQIRCLPSTYPYGCKQEWAFIYTTHQSAVVGAQFITFNVGGVAKNATGYFKNVNGAVVDSFTITHD